ncbi:MAG TPA: hypothetical protein VJR58_27845 [Vineibacter sp.]|nr:hypothetical protein [Vineibacter sp.]
MALLVHIAPEKAVPAIRRAGIRIPKWQHGVYAMPVLRNFFVSHQWIRELRRRGDRTLVGVYLRVPDDEAVRIGHYGGSPETVTAAAAVRAIMLAADPLGLQIIVPRKIVVKDIHAIRRLPQLVGWRYFPGAHGKRPCGCPACQPRGGIKTRKLRDAFEIDG